MTEISFLITVIGICLSLRLLMFSPLDLYIMLALEVLVDTVMCAFGRLVCPGRRIAEYRFLFLESKSGKRDQARRSTTAKEIRTTATRKRIVVCTSGLYRFSVLFSDCAIRVNCHEVPRLTIPCASTNLLL